jgi:hypothetical protein
MQRLVIALTTLLSLIGATVVVGYLLVFSASTDRAAAAIPANAPVYLNVYLQPSPAQQMQLGELLGRLPGFGDRATLDTKVDEALQQVLGGIGLDYRRDLRPWLGDQLAAAIWPSMEADASRTLLVAAVKDRPAADAALARLLAAGGATTSETYRDVQVTAGANGAYAFLSDDQVALATDAADLHAALDVVFGGEPSLAGVTSYREARETLPDDHLASVYLDFDKLALSTGGRQELAGISTAAFAVVATDAGIELTGAAPFDAEVASPSNRAAVALANEPPSLTDWMPETTQAEAVVFGLRRIVEAVEQQLGSAPGGEQVADALTQLRAIVAFGLGLSVDDDLLPLLDREVALAVSMDGGQPGGQLLLRPSDAAAAERALGRIAQALAERGASVTTAEAGGVTITSIDLPELGRAAYAMRDGVIVIGLDKAGVESALQAHAGRKTLAASTSYVDTFAALDAHGGPELYLDVPAALTLLDASDALSAETRDMLQHVGAIGVTMPARDDRIELHAIVTIR